MLGAFLHLPAVGTAAPRHPLRCDRLQHLLLRDEAPRDDHGRTEIALWMKTAEPEGQTRPKGRVGSTDKDTADTGGILSSQLFWGQHSSVRLYLWNKLMQVARDIFFV